MPFFNPGGEEIPEDPCRSRQVYATAAKLLTRDQLRSLIEAEGYWCQVVDPSDFRPLPDGPLEGETLLVAGNPGTLNGLPRHRRRAELLRTASVVVVDLIVECPFDAAQVLGALANLAAEFGEAALRCLKSARSLYAVNVPDQESPLAERVLNDLPKAIAKKVSGAIYDATEGTFLP